jgi:hypothetical protein
MALDAGGEEERRHGERKKHEAGDDVLHDLCEAGSRG